MSKQLIHLLTELIAIEVNSKEDLRFWYEKSNGVHEAAKRESIELPEIVEHYLSDADIRFKEPEYGAHQIEETKTWILSIEDSSTLSK